MTLLKTFLVTWRNSYWKSLLYIWNSEYLLMLFHYIFYCYIFIQTIYIYRIPKREIQGSWKVTCVFARIWRGWQHIKNILLHSSIVQYSVFIKKKKVKLVSQLKIWDWLTFPHILSPLWVFIWVYLNSHTHETIIYGAYWKGTCTDHLV